MSRRTSAVVLSLILIVFTAVVFFQTSRKQGFHCDEIYSFGLANNEEGHFFNIYEDDGRTVKWNTKEDIYKYLTVFDGAGFNYGSVIENQKNDVHPPLYYLIVHTVSSLFPGIYSKYMGMIINLFFMLAACVMLYLTALRMLKKRSLALLATVIYAFSANCINMTMYVRMYAALVFFCTALFYLNVRVADNSYKMSVADGVCTALCVFFGASVHYYFLIFAAGTFIYTLFVLIKDKAYGKLFVYCTPFVLSAFLYIIAWPTVFSHLFLSGRGTEAFDNAVKAYFLKNAVNNIKVIYTSTGKYMSVFILGCFVLYAVFFSRKCVSKHLPFAAAAGIFYFIVVTKVAPYQTDRYLSVLFPLIVIAAAYVIGFAADLIFSGVLKKCTLIKALTMFLIVFAVISGDIRFCFERSESSEKGYNYLYLMSDDTKTFLNNNTGKKCLMIHTNEPQFLMNLPDYEVFSQTAFVYLPEVYKIFDDETFLSEDEFVVYINNKIHPEAVLDRIVRKTNFTGYVYGLDAHSRNWANVFILYK